MAAHEYNTQEFPDNHPKARSPHEAPGYECSKDAFGLARDPFWWEESRRREDFLAMAPEKRALWQERGGYACPGQASAWFPTVLGGGTGDY